MDDTDRRILEFESQWWRARGNKEAAIREEFNWTAIRYAQKLNAVLDDPEALAHNPHLVNRLRRIRSGRSEARDKRAGIYSDDNDHHT